MNPEPIARLIREAAALRAVRFHYAAAHDRWRKDAEELWRAGEKEEAQSAQVTAAWLKFVWAGEIA